jgi:hypothetical protein
MMKHKEEANIKNFDTVSSGLSDVKEMPRPDVIREAQQTFA